MRILRSNISNYLRSVVARAIIHNDDLMIAEILEVRNRSESASDVGCFIVCDDNEADKGLVRHNSPPRLPLPHIFAMRHLLCTHGDRRASW